MSVSPRSRLYRLVPQGVGTGLVESLTSYVMRLAGAHRLSVSTLLRKLPALVPSHGDTSEAARNGGYANGREGAARLWVATLEAATTMPGLDRLTCLPLAEVLSSVHLVRATMAHCPECLDDMVGDVVYEPLIWVLQVMTACPTHHVALETRCRFCGCAQRALRLWGRPGICGSCRRWLGGSRDTAPEPGAEAEASEVAGLIAEPPGTRAAVSLAIKAATTNLGVTHRHFAALAGVAPSSISAWANGLERPSIDGLLAMCRVGGWSAAAFLDGRLETSSCAPEPTTGEWHAKTTRDWQAVASAVLGYLASDPPRTLTSIAVELGVDRRWLRQRLPFETQQVIDRYQAGLASRAAARLEANVKIVADVTLELLRTQGDAPRRAVEPLLPSGLQLQERSLGDAWRATKRAWADGRTAGL